MKNLFACFMAVTFVVAGYGTDKAKKVTLVGEVDFATGNEKIYKLTDRDQITVNELLNKKTNSKEEEQKRLEEFKKVVSQATKMKSNFVAERTLEKDTEEVSSTEKKDSKNSSVIVKNDEGKEVSKGKQACCRCCYGCGWGGYCRPFLGLGCYRPMPYYYGGCSMPPVAYYYPQVGIQPIMPACGYPAPYYGNTAFSQTTTFQQNSGIAPYAYTPQQTTVVTGPNGGTAVVNQPGIGYQVY